MQSEKDIDEIVKAKTKNVNNKKVIADMSDAINDMKKDEKINRRIALVTLFVILPIIIYFGFKKYFL